MGTNFGPKSGPKNPLTLQYIKTHKKLKREGKWVRELRRVHSYVSFVNQHLSREVLYQGPMRVKKLTNYKTSQSTHITQGIS